MESSHSKNLIGHISFFFTPKPNLIPKLYTFVYIFYSNTFTLLHIQRGLRTQEACLKTHKRELENKKFNMLYKVQGWHENPRLQRELFWQFWCVLLSQIMRFPPHAATNRFLSMTRTWYGSDLSKPIQGNKS
jgi:hypothetical protein